MGVARPGEPARPPRGELGRVTAKRLGEQRLRELREHGLAAGATRRRLPRGEPDRLLEPPARIVATDVHLERRRQPAQERPAQLPVARHVPADEARDFPATAHPRGLQPSRKGLGQVAGDFDEARGRTVREGVRVAVGKDDDVAGREVELRAALHGCRAAPVREQVVDHDMLASAPEMRRHGARRGGTEPPRRGELRVEKRAARGGALDHNRAVTANLTPQYHDAEERFKAGDGPRGEARGAPRDDRAPPEAQGHGEDARRPAQAALQARGRGRAARARRTRAPGRGRPREARGRRPVGPPRPAERRASRRFSRRSRTRTPRSATTRSRRARRCPG